MQKKRISINGLSHSYFDVGSGKQWMLLIHGNSLSSDTFKFQLENEELKKQYRMLAFDMAGYGDSDRSSKPDDDYSIQGQAKRTAEFCNLLKVSNPLIVAHSLGGNIAIEVTRFLPEVSRLILVSAPPAEKPMNQAMFNAHLAIPLFFTPELSDEQQEQLSKIIVASDEGIAFIKAILDQSDPNTRTSVYKSISSGEYEDQVEYLKTSKISLAMVLGTLDQLINPEYIGQLGLSLWKDKVQYIEQAGHSPFLENPSSFNELLFEMVHSHV